MIVLENTLCMKRNYNLKREREKKKEILNIKFQVAFDLLHFKLS